MDIVYEKGIPIPAVRAGKKGGLSDTLRKMEVGDSFAFSGPKTKANASSIRHAAKKIGIIVTIRSVGEDQCRAWRVA